MDFDKYCDVVPQKKLDDNTKGIFANAIYHKIPVKGFYYPAAEDDEPKEIIISIQKLLKTEDGYYAHAYRHNEKDYRTFSLSRFSSVELCQSTIFKDRLSPELLNVEKLVFIPNEELPNNKRLAICQERGVLDSQELTVECDQFQGFFVKHQLEKQGWKIK